VKKSTCFPKKLRWMWGSGDTVSWAEWPKSAVVGTRKHSKQKNTSLIKVGRKITFGD